MCGKLVTAAAYDNRPEAEVCVSAEPSMTAPFSPFTGEDGGSQMRGSAGASSEGKVLCKLQGCQIAADRISLAF